MQWRRLIDSLRSAWPLGRRRADDDLFRQQVAEKEADCLRRLDFVDAQVDRLARLDGPWRRHMTVAEGDIMPLSRTTQVIANLRAFSATQRWVLGVLCLLGLLVLVLAAVTLAAPEVQPGGPP